MHQEHQPQAGQEARTGFGETALARVAETSSAALAEQAKASVHARYVMAMQRPRDYMVVRQKLLADCKRPLFAEAAIYNKPVGDGVTGPSIRLAEAAARALGNIYTEVMAVFDDESKRIVRVTATDLEANLTYWKDVTIEKTIERSRPLPGRKVLNTRKNSRGFDVFVLDATSDEILDKENALTSKAMRTVLLRLVPGDLLDEALDQCYRTRDGEISQDLVGSRKRMTDAFASFGVGAEQVAEYLGHPIDTATADEMNKAKSVLSALKEKETTWAEVMDFVRQQRGTPPPASPFDAPANGNVANRMAAKANAVNADAGQTEPKPAPREVKAEPTTNAKPRGQSRFES